MADTSVLLNLCCIGQVELLARLFHEVVIPLEVASEFDRLARQAAHFQGLTLPGWVRRQRSSAISALVRAAHLDPGETAALALALEIHADALLVDERRGHQVAIQLGIKTIGVLGILLQARTSGLVPQVRLLLDQLEQQAQFWIAPAVRLSGRDGAGRDFVMGVYPMFRDETMISRPRVAAVAAYSRQSSGVRCAEITSISNGTCSASN